ncbi:MAG: ATP-binding protein [Thermoplasmata archaeon]|nr:MAG: ATP-binding protein [Thermoplasmata archaeon]
MAFSESNHRVSATGTAVQIGVIFGAVGTHEFKFAADEKLVKLSEYVMVHHETHGWVLGQIVELERESNVTYNRAQMISVGADVKVDSRLAAVVSVLGYKSDRGLIQMPHTPFSAGAEVYLADNTLISDIVGLDPAGVTGAYVGILKGHDIPVNININTLVQKHVSIIAKTGSGKSYMAGVLIEELLKRNIPIVVIDPHGEYSSMLHPNLDEKDLRVMNKFSVVPRGYPNAVSEFSVDTELNIGTSPLKLDGVRLQASELIPILSLKPTGMQLGILHQALKRVKEHTQYYTLRDLINEVLEDKNTLKWNLVNILEHLESLELFSSNPTPLKELVAPGKVTLINLRGVPPDIQDIVVAQLSHKLFDARKRMRIPAMLYVIEEAHNFCPQQGTSVSASILKTIASEGRKFGLGLCVVSQRPAKVDKNVLSQCNTQIILKVTNPNDLKALVASVEGLDFRMTNEIQRLPVSVALVSGGAINLPILVEVRPRETKHGGRPVEIVDQKAAGLAMEELSDPKSITGAGTDVEQPEGVDSDWYATLMAAYEDMIKSCKEPGLERPKPIGNDVKPEDDVKPDEEPEDLKWLTDKLEEPHKRREKR